MDRSCPANPVSPILRLRNIGLYYHRRRSVLRRERFWAVKDVSFDVYRGETLGVIGRNGAGKSTLLKILAGILNPDAGRLISHGGRAMLLSIGLGFIPDLSGRENAVLSGLILGADRQSMTAKMDEIIAFSELEDFIDQPVYSYSAGMRARLGFAVAFQMDPDIILLDDVLGVGDASFRQKSATAIREKVRSEKTVVLAAHQTQVMRDLCDRVVWIENGKSLMEGSAEEVLACYQRSVKSRQQSQQHPV